MVMVVLFIAAGPEFKAVLKHDLLQHPQLFHYPQVAVYGIEAEPTIFLAHIFINVLRR
ncbi:hypothetical protein D3C77_743500 [compost metagenome]